MLGGVLLGPVGLVGGALLGKNKNSYKIKIIYLDGTFSIANVDSVTMDLMYSTLNVSQA